MPQVQVVLVTGCSSGIGLAIACLLARDPDKRFVVYATLRRSVYQEPRFREAVKGILDETIFPVRMDVTDDGSVKEGVAVVMEKHRRIDVLVNNAGVVIQNLSEAASIESAKKLFDVNFFGVLRVTREVLPVMKKRRNGRIIMIGSDQNIFAYPFFGLYSATKQALHAFSQETAVKGRLFNIWVSLIEIGPVPTQLMDKMADQGLGGLDAMLKNPDVNALEKTLAKNLYSADSKNLYGFTPQPAGEVAEIVKGAITAENPHFLYQSTELIEEYARRHITDITGDSFIDHQVECLKPYLPDGLAFKK